MTDTAKEYGTALFMLACEEACEAEYAEALEKVSAVFEEERDYGEMLACPAIPMEERLSAIEAAFADAIPEKVLHFILLLCEKGRISCFGEAAAEYKALLDASRHIANVKVTSALSLTDEEKARLESKLETVYKGKINARYFIDRELLGGITVEVDGEIIDGSLRHRLREIKEVINT